MADPGPSYSGTGHKLNVSLEIGFFKNRVELCLTKSVDASPVEEHKGVVVPGPFPSKASIQPL
jgi:hypothetical protein